MKETLNVVHELNEESKKPELRGELEKKKVAADDVLKAERTEKEFPPGFLPRPKDHTVYAIGEDDYAFWDLLFGEGRKKEQERWRSLKARMEDSGETEPKSAAHMKMDKRQPGGKTNVSCTTRESG